MIAEGDIIYTKTLLGNGRENYKDKEILILGGGDGGVLHELLKESPKFVTMVEISLKNCCKLEVHAKRLRRYLTRKLSLSSDIKMYTLKPPVIPPSFDINYYALYMFSQKEHPSTKSRLFKRSLTTVQQNQKMFNSC